MARSIPIGQVLLNNGNITESQLNRALEFQNKSPGQRLGTILVDLGYVTEHDLLSAMSQQVNSPIVDVMGYAINPKATALLPRVVAEKYNVLPIDFKNDSLLLAVSDALAFYVFDEVTMITGMEVSLVLAESESIRECIRKAYSDDVINQVTNTVNDSFDEGDDAEDLSAMSERIEGTPVVQMVNMLISQAYSKGASDVHIEPAEKNLTVRYRINGDLVIHTTMKMAAHNPIVTRVKIMGGMNIAEKRIPQDGKYRFQQRDTIVDLRISTLPTIYGEKIVLRLLGNNQRNKLLDINKLGMEEEQLAKFERMLKAPNGILLVTGPTGSGKTTTLYATLSQAVKRKVNIITVEDPVEKVIEGTTQVQVNDKAGLTFEAALRSILRQDPDVIMIGEMRDGETATIGVRAAITGHQVLTTIHTNDCASSITRLIDMGVPAYMVATAISGIIAQRLVKLLCPHCREEYVPDHVEQMLFEEEDIERLWRPTGCERCNYTGYHGRTAIYEMMLIDNTLSELIAKGADVHSIRVAERNRGNQSLRQRVTALAKEGRTSVEEMEKIIYSVE